MNVPLLAVALGVFGYYLLGSKEQEQAPAPRPGDGPVPSVPPAQGGGYVPQQPPPAARAWAPPQRVPPPAVAQMPAKPLAGNIELAESNLQQMRSRIAAASSVLASQDQVVDMDHERAINGFKGAGAFGVERVATLLDSAGFGHVTQPFTQHAWALNSGLAKIPTANSYRTADANGQAAQMLATQMAGLYGEAIAAARRARGPLRA